MKALSLSKSTLSSGQGNSKWAYLIATITLPLSRVRTGIHSVQPECATKSNSTKPGGGSFQSPKVRNGTDRQTAELMRPGGAGHRPPRDHRDLRQKADPSFPGHRAMSIPVRASTIAVTFCLRQCGSLSHFARQTPHLGPASQIDLDISRRPNHAAST